MSDTTEKKGLCDEGKRLAHLVKLGKGANEEFLGAAMTKQILELAERNLVRHVADCGDCLESIQRQQH